MGRRRGLKDQSEIRSFLEAINTGGILAPVPPMSKEKLGESGQVGQALGKVWGN